MVFILWKTDKFWGRRSQSKFVLAKRLESTALYYTVRLRNVGYCPKYPYLINLLTYVICYTSPHFVDSLGTTAKCLQRKLGALKDVIWGLWPCIEMVYWVYEVQVSVGACMMTTWYGCDSHQMAALQCLVAASLPPRTMLCALLMGLKMKTNQLLNNKSSGQSLGLNLFWNPPSSCTPSRHVWWCSRGI